MLNRVRVDGKAFSRGDQRIRIQGVTYGPFAPNARQEFFPAPERVVDDFLKMQAAGVNCIRIYHVPPEWFLDLAHEHALGVFVDVPWRKHLCFLDSLEAQQEARDSVATVARLGRNHPCLLAYSIGNEIPPNVVRWHGAGRVERFLAELMDVTKQIDPEGLVTYANFPSTEFLDLSFLDFVTFNIYLHDREAFRRYLYRVQNLVADKPLLLGELGMDTLRHGQVAQADFLAGHLRAATLMGLAGSFVFSWTDDWHTGGFPVTDWEFGITSRERQPKASYFALRTVFHSHPAELLAEIPRVSVVVCVYNGDDTLEQCLRSLADLEYPNYEVIVVDDGSTDDTRLILDRFPGVTVIRQPNRGLSYARNEGLAAATGSIVAYTDSDCFADRNWLTHLVDRFQECDAAAVGGPNLTPEDGWLAACVAASPGQPTHVLESDQVAEHIPGCNMAFRRDALLAINGFDAQYRKAGDDVDVCWRLQQAGYWITFAPGAFVWHHRRQNPRAYLRQQIGYGEAEALLRFKHPDRFTGLGDGKWRGVIYGASLPGLRLDDAIIYRGTFGTGLFQCIYQPAPAHWAMTPGSLEWHLAAAAIGLTALVWPWAWLVVSLMLALSLTVAALQAAQANLAAKHDRLRARLLLVALCYFQPLVRSWSRYRTRFLAYRRPIVDAQSEFHDMRLPLKGTRTIQYWTEQGYDRTELLGLVIAYLNEHRWGRTVDSGWQDWDLEVYCHPWTIVQICTAQEDHGGRKRLIGIRFRLRASGYTRLLVTMAIITAGFGCLFQSWLGAGIALGFLVAALGAWWRGTRRASQAIALVETCARKLNLVRIGPKQCANPAPGTEPVAGTETEARDECVEAAT